MDIFQKCIQNPVKHFNTLSKFSGEMCPSAVAFPVDNFAVHALRSLIMPPRPINEQIFYPGHTETLSPVIFGKLLIPSELEYFHQGLKFSG